MGNSVPTELKSLNCKYLSILASYPISLFSFIKSQFSFLDKFYLPPSIKISHESQFEAFQKLPLTTHFSFRRRIKETIQEFLQNRQGQEWYPRA